MITERSENGMVEDERMSKVRSLIYAKYKNASLFADRIGWSRQKLSKVINGKYEPSLTDIIDIASGLDVKPIEIAQIF